MKRESESEVSQFYLTLCDPKDCSPQGASIHGIFQARILEWVAISFSRGSSWLRDWTCVSCIFPTLSSVQLLSCVQLFATPWTVSHQAPLSVGFSRQEYWNGKPFPSPGNLPNPGIEPESPALVSGFFTVWATRKEKAIGMKHWLLFVQGLPLRASIPPGSENSHLTFSRVCTKPGLPDSETS